MVRDTSIFFFVGAFAAPIVIFGAEVAAPVFQQIATRLMSLKGVAEDDPAWTQYKAAHSPARLPRNFPVTRRMNSTVKHGTSHDER